MELRGGGGRTSFAIWKRVRLQENRSAEPSGTAWYHRVTTDPTREQSVRIPPVLMLQDSIRTSVASC